MTVTCGLKIRGKVTSNVVTCCLVMWHKQIYFRYGQYAHEVQNAFTTTFITQALWQSIYSWAIHLNVKCPTYTTDTICKTGTQTIARQCRPIQQTIIPGVASMWKLKKIYKLRLFLILFPNFSNVQYSSVYFMLSFQSCVNIQLLNKATQFALNHILVVVYRSD